MPKRTFSDLPDYNYRLPVAKSGWLEEQLAKLPGLSVALSRCGDSVSVMREAVVQAKEQLGLRRVGIWLLENGGKTAAGTFGLDIEGNLADERSERFYDNSGGIRRMMDAWSRSPYYFKQVFGPLRSGDSKRVGQGAMLSAPLFSKGEIIGFVSIDNLLDSNGINSSSGAFLCQFAQVVSTAFTFKQMEERLLESEVAVRDSERVQSEFLGVMGHEVRTPLNAMLGYAQLLRNREISKEVTEIATIIEECGGHMSSLVDSALEYSHLSSGDIKRWYKVGDPAEAIASTVNSFGALYSRAGLTLDLRFEGKRSAVEFDAVSLRQVLSNLLQNSLKYTKKGGVEVSVYSRTEGKSSTFYIEVKDSGIGIAREHLEGVFQPFRQVNRPQERTGGGIGMGLAIVKRLVAAMGGKVSCRSEIGEGTVFTLDLSFANAEQDQGGNAIDHSLSRILIVEDDEINLRVLLAMAHRLGYSNTETARDGVDASRLLAERPYDLVLMDVQMPHLSGIELTRIVRKGRACPINRKVPIIGVTAYTSKHDRDECLTVGMNDYIAKPVGLDALRRAMEMV